MKGLTTKTISRPVSQISMPISDERAACSSRAVNKTIEGEDGDSTCHGLVARTRFNKPKVTSETEYCFVSGNTALMQCQIAGKVEKVSWKKRKETDDAFCDIRIDNKKYFGGSVASPSLVIASVGGDDAGTYICRATNDVGEGETGEIEVTVKDNVKDNVAVMPTVFNQAVEIAKTSNVNVNLTFLNNVNSSVIGKNGLIVNQDTTDRDPKKLLQNMEEISRAAKSEAQKYVEAFGKIQELGFHCEEDVRGISVKFIIDDDVTPDSNFQNKLQRLISKALNVPDGRIIRIEIIKHCIIVSFDIVGASKPWEMSALWLAERFRSGLADGSICLTDGQGKPLSIREDSTEIFNVSSENPDSSDIPIVSLEKGCFMEAVGGISILKCTALSSSPIISVKWFRINKEQETEYEVSIDNKKYYGGSVESPSLVINNTDHSDQGLYICRAENKHGTGDSKPGLLLIFNKDGQVLPEIIGEAEVNKPELMEANPKALQAKMAFKAKLETILEVLENVAMEAMEQGVIETEQEHMKTAMEAFLEVLKNKHEFMEATPEVLLAFQANIEAIWEGFKQEIMEATEHVAMDHGAMEAEQEPIITKMEPIGETMENKPESMEADMKALLALLAKLEAIWEDLEHLTMEAMEQGVIEAKQGPIISGMEAIREVLKNKPDFMEATPEAFQAHMAFQAKAKDVWEGLKQEAVEAMEHGVTKAKKEPMMTGMEDKWRTLKDKHESMEAKPEALQVTLEAIREAIKAKFKQITIEIMSIIPCMTNRKP